MTAHVGIGPRRAPKVEDGGVSAGNQIHFNQQAIGGASFPGDLRVIVIVDNRVGARADFGFVVLRIFEGEFRPDILDTSGLFVPAPAKTCHNEREDQDGGKYAHTQSLTLRQWPNGGKIHQAPLALLDDRSKGMPYHAELMTARQTAR